MAAARFLWHARTHTRTHTRTHGRAQTHARTRTHARMHTRTQTQTQTHSHTRERGASLLLRKGGRLTVGNCGGGGGGGGGGCQDFMEIGAVKQILLEQLSMRAEQEGTARWARRAARDIL